MQLETRWVCEWEEPHFYTMLVQEWQTTASWTGYKDNLLRERGINVMSTAEYQMATQNGGLPFPSSILNFY
jgi:hypothetical protein